MVTLLEKARAESGLTQSALAEAAGVHRKTIARAEDGQPPARYMTRLKIARALGVEMTDLFTDDVA
jgi:DNA-binding XRE family transcriptional regulator